jgi:nuclear pore complex protein Nup133
LRVYIHDKYAASSVTYVIVLIFFRNSWDVIKKTSGVSDAQLNDRFRSTALVATLTATLPKRHQPEGYILSPSQALAVPSLAELSSRWPGMSPEQIEALREDYQEESDLLAEYDLADAFNRARELILDEMMWGRVP